jgi:hypothetical protein
MKRAACIVLTLIGLLTFAPRIFAADSQSKGTEQKDLSREKKAFRNYSGEGSSSITSFCMEGQVFVMMTGDNSNNFFLMQVYEEKNGKTVPKKCG